MNIYKILMAMMTLILLTNCAKHSENTNTVKENKIVGKWSYTDETTNKEILAFDFKQNGNVNYFGNHLNFFDCDDLFERGQYEIENDSILVLYYEGNIEHNFHVYEVNTYQPTSIPRNFNEIKSYEVVKSSLRFKIDDLSNKRITLVNTANYYTEYHDEIIESFSLNKLNDNDSYIRPFKRSKKRHKNSMEAQSAILTIRAGFRIRYQTYGVSKNFTIEDALKMVRISDSAKKNWQFQVEGNPPEKFIAISTEHFPDGKGKKVWYSVKDKEYYGYGAKEAQLD